MKRLEISGWAPYWRVSKIWYSHILRFVPSEIDVRPLLLVAAIWCRPEESLRFVVSPSIAWVDPSLSQRLPPSSEEDEFQLPLSQSSGQRASREHCCSLQGQIMTGITGPPTTKTHKLRGSKTLYGLLCTAVPFGSLSTVWLVTCRENMHCAHPFSELYKF